MKLTLLIIGTIIISYLIGSIPFALIISKTFFHKDIRNEGSNNLGATNMARTTKFSAGLIVFAIDIIKSGLTGMLIVLFTQKVMNLPEYSALIYCISCFFVAIGHCFPIFASFRGGKGVANIVGFLLFLNWKYALIGLGTFLLVTLISKIVALGSMSADVATFIGALFPAISICYPYIEKYKDNTPYAIPIVFILFTILLFSRHIANIKRMINGNENKIKLFKKTR